MVPRIRIIPGTTSSKDNLPSYSGKMITIKNINAIKEKERSQLNTA